MRGKREGGGGGREGPPRRGRERERGESGGGGERASHTPLHFLSLLSLSIRRLFPLAPSQLHTPNTPWPLWKPPPPPPSPSPRPPTPWTSRRARSPWRSSRCAGRGAERGEETCRCACAWRLAHAPRALRVLSLVRPSDRRPGSPTLPGGRGGRWSRPRLWAEGRELSPRAPFCIFLGLHLSVVSPPSGGRPHARPCRGGLCGRPSSVLTGEQAAVALARRRSLREENRHTHTPRTQRRRRFAHVAPRGLFNLLRAFLSPSLSHPSSPPLSPLSTPRRSWASPPATSRS